MKKLPLILKTSFAVLLGCLMLLLSGCGFFDFSNGIAAVRERVEVLRHEMSETMIEAFKNRDIAAVKNLFCRKTREIEGLDGQIEETFDFMDGGIASYTISGSTGYEGYSNDYGTVTQYSFGSDIYITTDTGRNYDLYLSVHYIELDDSIEGLLFYSLFENDRDYEDRTRCRAGYGWTSPYDAECGILSAKLVNAVAAADAATVKSLLCAETLENPELDGQIQAVFEFFDGAPLFSERADGLYGGWDGGNEFSCRVLGYEIERDAEGSPVGIWVSVLTQSVLTDTGKDYTLSFAAYLKSDKNPQIAGISYFSFEDSKTDEEKQVGAWLHD